MKRIALLLSACAFAVSAAVAQDGTRTLEYPSAGSFAVGIEASPILDFVGNMFNGNTDNASASRWDKSDYTIHGRYFLTDNSAVRLHLRFNPSDNKTVTTKFIQDDAAKTLNPLSNDKVEDKKVEWKNDWRVAAGYQMFRGRGPLRGFFGGDVFYRYEKSLTNYYYGNKMNSFNSSPTTWDYTANAANPAAERTLNNYGGGKHSLGLIGFTGAEYYFISNACVGFEVGLILQGSITTRGKSISEKMLGADRITIENETAPDSNFFHFGTNAGKKDLGGSTGKAGLAGTGFGNFYIMFHF